MTESHPYISGPGNITKMIMKLRKSFPNSISAETVKKFGIAPKNESRVINTLQFLGIIDIDGKKIKETEKVFTRHKDDEFYKAFSKLVENSYSALFELYRQDAWSLGIDDLITFFRENDQTGAAIGRNQANTFKALAGLSGHGELPTIKDKSARKNTSKKAKKKKTGSAASNSDSDKKTSKLLEKDIGLTVRIEINLPGDGNKETYDNIFKSIKENLLGG